MSSPVEKRNALRNLLDLYVSLYTERGFDIEAFAAAWAEQKRESLKDFAAEGKFDELCRAGCKRLPLAITITLMRPLQSFEKKWQSVTKSARNRKQKILAIEKGATALEELLSSTA